MDTLGTNLFILFCGAVMTLGCGRYTFLAWFRLEALLAELQETKTLLPNYFVLVARFIAPLGVILGIILCISSIGDVVLFVLWGSIRDYRMYFVYW